MSHEIHRVVAGHVDSRIEAEIAEAMRVATAPGCAYAYRFVAFDGTDDLLEVRAFVDGTVKLTHCDYRGLPIQQAQPERVTGPSAPPTAAPEPIVQKRSRWGRR